MGPGVMTKQLRVVVVHSIWIHYMHYLFCAMAKKLSLHVLLIAPTSRQRLRNADLMGLEYGVTVLGDTLFIEDTGTVASGVRAYSELKRLRPDCLIIAGWFSAAAWCAWLWGIVNKCPMVLWAESNAFDRSRTWVKELPKRIFVRRFRAVHVYGISNRDYIRSLGVAAEKIAVGRAVVNTEHLTQERSRIEDGRRRLLYVGRFAPEKNLERLLLAVQRHVEEMPESKVTLRMVGQGVVEGKLRAMIAELGLSKRVELTGAVEHEKLGVEYASADVLILPSLSEPWGLVVAEAMACGLAVAVSNRCGCAADLVTAETGWTFPPESVDGIAGVLRDVDSLSMQEIKEKGSHGVRVVERYSPKNVASRVCEVVERAINQSERR